MSPPAIELRLRGSGGEPVDLWRTLVSHGFADLAPMALDEEARTLELTLRIPRGRPRRIRIGAAHVLRLDQDLSRFYALAAQDPDLSWAALGAGRMLRSPTVWEDVVKTLCTTNCSWGLTTFMVNALVRELGEPAAGLAAEPLANAFPTPEAMASRDERFYREQVHAGYRATSLVRLSAMVADGEVDLERLGVATREELPDEDVEALLRSLPGIGPYAAAHVMMTLGRNSRLILDSWTRPTYARAARRRTVPSDAVIERRFRGYGADAGLAFWLFVTKHWVEDAGPAARTDAS